MEELLRILEGVIPGTDVEKEKALIDDGILDSFAIVGLVGELSEAFDIEIGPKYLIPENFNSAAAIWEMIQSIQNEG